MQISPSVKAQGYFTFGYGALYGPFTELNKMVYLSNVRNDVDKKMGKFHFANGLNLGLGFEEYGIGAELRVHNYHTKKKNEYSVSGQATIQELRMDWTSIDLNFTFGEEAKFGFGTNFGGLRFNSRTYLKGGEESEYEAISGSKALRSVLGVNIFGEVPLGDFIRLRLSYFLNGSAGTGSVRTFLNTGIGGPFNPDVKMNVVSLDLFIKLGGE